MVRRSLKTTKKRKITRKFLRERFLYDFDKISGTKEGTFKLYESSRFRDLTPREWRKMAVRILRDKGILAKVVHVEVNRKNRRYMAEIKLIDEYIY